MDAFSYLSVLLSIILGLAITQILKGVRGLLLSRARVVVFWPTLGWAALLMLICVQGWWSMFGLREGVVWTFPRFATVTLQTITTCMLAALVLPDFFGAQTTGPRAPYCAHRRRFFGVFVLALLISLATDLVLTGRLSDNANLAFHACFLAAATTG